LSIRLRVRSPRLSIAATFHPRRFTRPRRLNPLRPLPKSPSNTTRGVFSLQGSPDSLGTAPSPTLPPLMTFLATAPAFTGTSCLASLPRRVSRVLLLRLDRIRQLLVAHSSGTVRPLGFLLCRTSLPQARPGRNLITLKAVRPRHLSRIEKEQQRAEKKPTPPNPCPQHPL